MEKASGCWYCHSMMLIGLVKQLYCEKEDEEFITLFLKELEVMKNLRPHKNIGITDLLIPLMI